MYDGKIKCLKSLDWELENANTQYLTHNFHRYSSKYIPQIPNRIIKSFTYKGEVVLDNFMGSGTTLVECKLLGRNGIGMDINKLACLISKVKTTNIEQNILSEENKRLSNKIGVKISTIRQQKSLFTFENNDSADIEFDTPRNKEIERWFQPNVVKELGIIKNEINKVENNYLKDFYFVAFSSIIRGVSNAASEYGNLMIDKNIGKKDKVYEKFLGRIDKMTKKIISYNKKIHNESTIKIYNNDCRFIKCVDDESIDLICTHPPYMAAVPYAEYQKLSQWWLGWNPYQLDRIIIGGQRRRDDTAERFLNDMEQVFKNMYRVLKEKKICCVVIGNPIYRRKLWRLNDIFKNIAKKHGFTFLDEIIRGKYNTTMGKMKEEYIQFYLKN